MCCLWIGLGVESSVILKKSLFSLGFFIKHIYQQALAIGFLAFWTPLWVWAAEALRYAPIPTENLSYVYQSNQPLAEYLAEQLGQPVEIQLREKYSHILQDLHTNKIDLALMGPLSYALYRQKHPQQLRVLGSFANAQGEVDYNCALVSFGQGPLDWSQMRIALTQPLSTCGYLGAMDILQSQNRDIAQLDFYFAGSQEEAARELILGHAQLAVISRDIAHKFDYMGLHIRALSQNFPSFILVANSQTLSSETLKKLQGALAKLHLPSHSTESKKLVNWPPYFQNGFVMYSQPNMDPVESLLRQMPAYLWESIFE